MSDAMSWEAVIDKRVISNDNQHLGKVTSIGTNDIHIKVEHTGDNPQGKEPLKGGIFQYILPRQVVMFMPNEPLKVSLSMDEINNTYRFLQVPMGSFGLRLFEGRFIQEKPLVPVVGRGSIETVIKLTLIEQEINNKIRINKNDLVVIDDIRRSFLSKAHDDQNHQILDKSINLFLNYYDNCLVSLHDDLLKKKIEEMDYGKRRRKLLHLKYRIKQNDARNLDELEEEANQFISTIEDLSNKILPSFIK